MTVAQLIVCVCVCVCVWGDTAVTVALPGVVLHHRQLLSHLQQLLQDRQCIHRAMDIVDQHQGQVEEGAAKLRVQLKINTLTTVLSWCTMAGLLNIKVHIYFMQNIFKGDKR